MKRFELDMILQLGVVTVFSVIMSVHAIDGTANVPVPTDENNTCIYYNKQISNGHELHLGYGGDNPCQKLYCEGGQKMVMVTGCPPPAPYLQYFQTTKTSTDSKQSWPYCCPGLEELYTGGKQK
uniref:Single domain-containing protein n=1 Tax=Amblyomma maculatum TaxID=34609 RepID=G3MQC2_AMBMU